MPREVKDITKSFQKVCEICNIKQKCPYENKFHCLNVRSDSETVWDQDISELSLNRNNDYVTEDTSTDI